VVDVNVNLLSGKVAVPYELDKTGAPQMVKMVQDIGYEVPEEEVLLTVRGMTCSSCVAMVEKVVKGLPGVTSVVVNLPAESAKVKFYPGIIDKARIKREIVALGYESGVYSLIFFVIDNFRNFHNHFGHDVGDNVLKKVGETIKVCVRATDRVYRYGGEEIILLLLNCDKKNAMKMAEKIRSEISLLDNQAYSQITVSLGVSSYPDDGRYIHDVIIASDKALLKAKQSGKNCTISC